MPVRLYDWNKRCLDSKLGACNKVTAVSGFGSHVVIGTNAGVLHIFDRQNGWEEEAKVYLSEEKECRVSITQICCASAIEQIFVVFGNVLVGITLSNELLIEQLFVGVKRIALNSHPTNDDPFSVQMAVASDKKGQITVGHFSIDQGPFIGEYKMNTGNGCPVELAFNGACICFSTDEGGYFVQNLGEKNAVKLFDASNPDIPRIICPVQIGEFALNGVQGLLMFVNSRGMSTRPPISVPDGRPLVGLALKEPFLFLLNFNGTIYLFSKDDHKLKQTFSLPTGEGDLHLQHKYQMANIDGFLLIVPPSANCLFELISVPLFEQIEEQIRNGQLDDSIISLDDIIMQYEAHSSENDVLLFHRLYERVAFLLIQQGNFSKGLSSLLKCEANPQALISIFERQNELSVFGEEQLPIDDEFPKIPFDALKGYLEEILVQQWAQPFLMSIETALVKLYVLMDDSSNLQRVVLTSSKTWNDSKFRKWLVDEKKRLDFAAKLAADAGSIDEALSIWREMAKIDLFGKEQISECLDVLKKCSTEMLIQALPWLITMNPEMCMETVEELGQYGGDKEERAIEPETLVELFCNEHPLLLLQYLEKRIYSIKSPNVHNCFLELLLRFKEDGLEGMGRRKLWHFLLFSSYYDRQIANRQFENSGSQCFIESILMKTNSENAVNCLRELTSHLEASVSNADDLDNMLPAAELLCTRFPNPDMLKAMLTVHLRLSRTDSSRLHIPNILPLLDSDVDAFEVLNSLPEDISSSVLIKSFLRRHMARQLNMAEWRELQAKLARRGQMRSRKELDEKLKKTRFEVDEHSLCYICKRALAADEEFVRDPHTEQLAHLRCHRATKKQLVT